MLQVLLGNKFLITGNENKISTRQAGNIVLQIPENQECKKSVFHEGIKMYNYLPASIKQSDRLFDI